jgi:hypothetical protein
MVTIANKNGGCVVKSYNDLNMKVIAGAIILYMEFQLNYFP